MTKGIINIVILFISINLSAVYGQTEDFSREKNIDSTRLFLGISAGYQNVIHKDALYQFGDAYCLMNIPKAYGNGYYIGFNLKYPVFKKIAPNQFLFLNILFKNHFANAEYDYGKVTIIKPNGVPPYQFDTVLTTMSAEMSFSYITIDLLYSIKLSNSVPFHIIQGMTVSFLVDDNFTQIYSIKSQNPDHKFTLVPGYEYRDNGRSVVVYDKEIQNATKIVPGIQFGLSYEMKITDKIQLLPEIYYTWHLLRVVNAPSWHLLNWSAGISMLYAID